MFHSLSAEEKKQWEEKIFHQQQSKKSALRWCRDNGERYSAFLYWKRQLFPETVIKRSSFTEITNISKETGIALEYQGIRLYVERQFDSSTLKQCLKVLREMPC